MRIAWFTPFNPKSAIGHYSEEITRELARTDSLVLYVSDVSPKTSPRRTALPIVPLDDDPSDGLLRQLDAFDAVVYNMGNYPPFHKRIYEVLSRRPGVVVLHDLVLRDFLQSYYLNDKRDPEGFARQVAYSDGPASAEAYRAFWEGRSGDPDADRDPLQSPMFPAVLHRCLGVVVHSEYGRGRVAAATSAPVVKLDFPPFGQCVGQARRKARAWDKSDAKVRLLTFGYLNRNKQIHAVIEAIARSETLRANVHYIIVGEGDGAYPQELRRQVESEGLSDVVRLTGWLSDARLWTEVTRADLVLNLRNPHLGESSGTLLNALLAGTAAVVWNHGWYAEFPDDVVWKVSSEAELAGALERLCRDPELRRRLGAEARRHAVARFSTAAYCRGFRAFMDEVLARRPLLAVADALSDLLLEFGPCPPDGLVERLASEVAVLAGRAAGCDGRAARDHVVEKLIA